MDNQIILSDSSKEIIYLKSKDKRLAKVINMIGPLTYSTREGSEYAFLIHEIIEQMLSIKAGKSIYERLEKLCDGNISPEKVARLSEEQLRSIGTSTSKAQYIKGITEAVIEKKLEFDALPALDNKEVMNILTSFRGIGNWTAKMYLIFVLNRMDILPYEDGAFLQSYRWLYKTDDCSKDSIQKKCSKWKPYESIASRYLYRALDMGLTKDEFHLFK